MSTQCKAAVALDGSCLYDAEGRGSGDGTVVIMNAVHVDGILLPLAACCLMLLLIGAANLLQRVFQKIMVSAVPYIFLSVVGPGWVPWAWDYGQTADEIARVAMRRE